MRPVSCMLWIECNALHRTVRRFGGMKDRKHCVSGRTARRPYDAMAIGLPPKKTQSPMLLELLSYGSAPGLAVEYRRPRCVTSGSLCRGGARPARSRAGVEIRLLGEMLKADGGRLARASGGPSSEVPCEAGSNSRAEQPGTPSKSQRRTELLHADGGDPPASSPAPKGQSASFPSLQDLQGRSSSQRWER